MRLSLRKLPFGIWRNDFKAEHVHKKANKAKKQANDLKTDKAAETAAPEAEAASPLTGQGKTTTETAPAAAQEQAPAAK